MKTNTTKPAAGISALLLTLALALPASAQTDAGSTGAQTEPSGSEQSTMPGSMQAAPTDAETTRSDDTTDSAMAAAEDMKRPKKGGEIIGKNINGDDGNKVGAISDLVINADSGEITHAVVSAGGVLGIGAEKKAVSFDALQPSMVEPGAMTITTDGWANATDFQEDQLATLAEGDQLVLASNLDGLDLRAEDGTSIGEVEDVIVKANDNKASLLVDVAENVSGDDRSYVIAFNRASLSGTDDNRLFTTELQESDFRTAAANDGDTEQSYIWLEGESQGAVAE